MPTFQMRAKILPQRACERQEPGRETSPSVQGRLAAIADIFD